MGLLQRMSTTVAPARMRADADPFADQYNGYVPPGWYGVLSQAGVRVNADLAMTLSSVWRVVSGMVSDLSTLPCQVFRRLEDGGKQRVRTHALSYLLRWQPNAFQTAQQFFGMMLAHQLLRGNAYVEIVPGARGFADQLLPRHPDRVRKERLPNGRIRYRLINGNIDGADRFLTSDEMMHAPDILTLDGWLGASRIDYATQSIGGMLAAESAAQHFFSRGMTASMVVTLKGQGGTGERDEAELKNIHTSLSMYASGVKNNGGILILEEDMGIANLGVDPEKAQLLATRQHGTKEVARWFGYPGHKLETDGQTQAYAAREQANLEYVIGTVRPILINWEQTIQKDLILEKDDFFTEFLIDALFRGDLKSQADYYKAAIQFGWMNRNEVRLRSNLNPAAGLDRFLEPENMRDADPSVARRRQQQEARSVGRGQSAGVRAALLAYETGQRIVRKEIAAVTKLAKQHANDPDAWKAGLQTFYQDHAAFVAETLHVALPEAREYAAEHGLALAKQGVVVMEGWEHVVAHELAAWALEGDRAA